MLLYTLIVVWFAQEGHKLYRPLERPWYTGKVYPSFADMLGTLRVETMREVFCSSGRNTPLSKPVDLLLHTLRAAA